MKKVTQKRKKQEKKKSLSCVFSMSKGPGHRLRKCDGFTSFPQKPELIHCREKKKQEHKWSCLAGFNEVLNFSVFLCDGTESCENGNYLECGKFKTLLGFHNAGLPECRSVGNLVLYGAITAR